MKMKKLVAMLMLLCAALFVLPAYAAEWNPLGNLVLNGWDSNGSFIRAELTDVSGVNYIVVTGSTFKAEPTGMTLVFTDKFSDAKPNGFRVYKTEGKSAATILNFIKSIQFNNPEYARVELLASDPGRMYFNPENRHYYRYVHETSIAPEGATYAGSEVGPSWNKALQDAASDSNKRFGRQGYLATITSNVENTFVMDMLTREQSELVSENKTPESAWISGTRWPIKTDGTIDTDTQTQNAWYWAAGPEKNTKFYQGESQTITSGGTTTTYYGQYNSENTGTQVPSGAFAHWNNPDFGGTGKEPNDSSRNEYVTQLYFNHSADADYFWNDLPGTSTTAVFGYIIEYGNKSGTGATSGGSYTGQGGGDTDEAKRKLTLVTNDGKYQNYNPPTQFATGHGATLPTKDDIELAGYELAGWYNNEALTDGPHTAVTTKYWNTDQTYYAKWTAELAYVLNGGSTTATLDNTYTYKKKTQFPAAGTMSREGYDFAGWYADANFTGAAMTSYTGEEGGGKKTFYAKWTPRTGTITLKLNGGEYGGETSIPYDYEDNFTLPDEDDVTRVGYIFDGWKDKNGNIVTTISGTYGDKELTAQWTARTDMPYTVKYYFQNVEKNGYDLDDTLTEDREGTMDQPTTVTADNLSAAAKAKAADGFTQTVVSITNVEINGTAGQVVEVKFDRNTYNVTFENFGLGTKPDQMARNHEAALAAADMPTPVTAETSENGYQFAGWFTNPMDDTTKVESIAAVTADVKLYAVWTRDVTVNMAWSDNNNAAGRRFEVVFELPDDETGSITAAQDEANHLYADRAVHSYTANGDGYSAAPIDFKPVVTTAMQNSYTCVVSDATVSGSGVTYSITLTYSTENYGTDGTLSGVVFWNDNDDQDGKRPKDKVIVTLYKKVKGIDTKVEDAEVEAKPGDTWPYTFDGLPKYEGGAEIEYFVNIVYPNLPGGYTLTKADHDTTVDGNDELRLELTHEALAVPVTVTIQWADKDGALLDAAAAHPARPKVTAKIIGGAGATFEFAGAVGEDWTESKNLSRYQSKVLITYAADAALTLAPVDTTDNSNSDKGYELVAGYPTSVPAAGETVTETTEFVFTYRLKPKTWTISYPDGMSDLMEGEPTTYTYGEELTIPAPEKEGYTFGVWEIYDPADPDNPAKTVPLTDNKIPVGTVPSDGQDTIHVRPSKEEAGKYTITYEWYGTVSPVDGVVPPADANPTEFTAADWHSSVPAQLYGAHYKLGEYTFGGWYTNPQYTGDPVDDIHDLPIANQSSFTLYARWLTKLGPYSANWDDGNDQDELRKPVVFYLYEVQDDNSMAEPAPIDPENNNFVLPKAEEGTGKLDVRISDKYFENVTVHDADGNVIKYEVKPDLSEMKDRYNAPAYSYDHATALDENGNVTDTNDNHFRIKRTTYEKLFTVKVVWEDNNNEWGTRPTSLDVELFEEGDKLFVKPPASALKQTLHAGNGWKTEWVAQVNESKPAMLPELTFNVKMVTYPGAEYVMSEMLNKENTEKIITFTLRSLLLPPTGDESDLLLWGGVLALSAGALGLLGFKRRKRKA